MFLYTSLTFVTVLQRRGSTITGLPRFISFYTEQQPSNHQTKVEKLFEGYTSTKTILGHWRSK